MVVTISLRPEIEAQLKAKAADQGQDINILATELLTQLLEWEQQDTEAAIARVQQGLDDFTEGRSRSFETFADEQCHKYDLPANT
ncbi:MAG: hypothetical protein ACFCU8_14470 [Thermosynechococcaceae cyanobacterium]